MNTLQKEIEKIQPTNTDRFQIRHTELQTVIALKAPWLIHGVVINFTKGGKFENGGEVFGTPVDNKVKPFLNFDEALLFIKENFKD